LEKRLRESPGGAPYALGTSSPVTTISSWLDACARTERSAPRKIELAHTISGRSRRRRSPQKKSVFLIESAHHYKIVMNGKTNFSGFSDGTPFTFRANRSLPIAICSTNLLKFSPRLVWILVPGRCERVGRAPASGFRLDGRLSTASPQVG